MRPYFMKRLHSRRVKHQSQSQTRAEPLCRHCGQLWFKPSATVCNTVKQMQYTVQFFLILISLASIVRANSGSFVRAPTSSYLRWFKSRFRVYFTPQLTATGVDIRLPTSAITNLRTVLWPAVQE
jgi:hypothetical protein